MFCIEKRENFSLENKTLNILCQDDIINLERYMQNILKEMIVAAQKRKRMNRQKCGAHPSEKI